MHSITQFNFPTTVRFGIGVINEVADYLKNEQLNSPLLVVDKNLSSLPVFTQFKSNLLKKGLKAVIFDDIHKNPIKSDVLKGTDVFDQSSSDCVIGFGGGTAIDVARAIVLRVNHRDDLFKYDDLKGGSIYVTNAVPHFIAIPTVAGTGSEVGRSAIIADDLTKEKKILFAPKLMAKIVFADPSLTMDIPAHITAATGMDALTHNIEAYLAKNYHPICDGIAIQGIKMIHQSLLLCCTKPTIESRSTMLLASMMGAIAFQKGLGVVHSLAHPLSSLLDTHHGLANGIMLPYGLSFNLPYCTPQFKDIAQALDIKSSNGEEVIQYIKKLNEQIGIPANLQSIGVTQEHTEILAQMAENDFAHINNPIPVNRKNFKEIYLKAI
ncbi:MAG: iron-containing alcohol dehydrogenase [Phycisphaerales bacterium]|nr:iron-containing alcohol dehydrogenase [Phycisphaerales bacterium]